MITFQKQFTEHLISRGILSHDQVAAADDYASNRKITLEEAILALDMLKAADLVKYISNLSQLPYRPLFDSPPSEEATNLFPLACANRWKAFPVEFDADQHMLVLSIHDPAQMEQLQRIHDFFLQSPTLAFVIAPQYEIERAVVRYLGGAPSPSAEPKAAAEPRKPQVLSALHQAVAAQPAAGRPAASLTKPIHAAPAGTVRRDRGTERHEPEVSHEDLSPSLISAVSALVETRLVSDSALLADTRGRARHAQLLASRLAFSPAQVNRVVLATWFSAVEGQTDLAGRVVMPESVREVLHSRDKPGPEALALSLVRSYEDLRKQDPVACKDVSLIRRNLRMLWSAPPESHGMLETFLQLLMDEEFLTKLGQSAGRILILDAAESATSALTTPLTSDGYEVHAVPTPEAAQAFLGQSTPDLILADVEEADRNLRFCERLKRSPATTAIPLVALVSQRNERRAAQSLRAGADDFLTRPVDVEVLFLKIGKLLATARPEASRTGVSGSLEDVGFTDMIQILCVGNKNMEVVLTREGEEAHVFVQGGEIVHATVGSRQAEAAFYELVKWRTGDFTTRPCAEFPERTIHASVTGLLMEGSRRADEGTTAGT